jgi:hypothetical protein
MIQTWRDARALVSTRRHGPLRNSRAPRQASPAVSRRLTVRAVGVRALADVITALRPGYEPNRPAVDQGQTYQACVQAASFVR